jgi:hypothetical protein
MRPSAVALAIPLDRARVYWHVDEKGQKNGREKRRKKGKRKREKEKKIPAGLLPSPSGSTRRGCMWRSLTRN